MQKLGADIEQVKVIACSRKSYWNSSMFIGIYITNNKLKQKGLVFPLDHYLKVHTVIKIEPPYTERYVRWCERDKLNIKYII